MTLKSRKFIYDLFREFGNGRFMSLVKCVRCAFGLRARVHPRKSLN